MNKALTLFLTCALSPLLPQTTTFAQEYRVMGDVREEAVQKLTPEKRKQYEFLFKSGNRQAALNMLLEDQKLEQQRKTQIPGYKRFEICVSQVIPNGILADVLITAPLSSVFGPTPVSSLGRIGGGGTGPSNTGSIAKKSGKIICIQGNFSGVVDNAWLWIEAAQMTTTFSYQDTRGATRTVECWQQIKP